MDVDVPQGAGGSRLGRLHSLVFRWLPAIVLAEPFEIFLAVLAAVDSATLGLRLRDGTAGRMGLVELFYGQTGLLAWIGFMVLCSALTLGGLATAARHDSLAVRKFEAAGITGYGIGFGFYGYTNLALGLGRHGVPDVYPALSEIVIVVLTGACFVRAVALTAPITALAVTRVQRIKFIKEMMRNGPG